jgi:hypothetical protein
VPRAVLLTAAVAVAVTVAATVAVLVSGLPGGSDRVAPPAAPGRDDVAVRVLRAWDARRTAAYAAGSPARLADLYVAGSSAGTADVRVLRGYLGRGLRVRGLRMQLLAVAVVDRQPDRWRVTVTDRVAGGVAVGRGRRLVLPRDRADTHVVTLMRAGDHRWRVAAVSRAG